mmetsp:Transcript_53720/g.142865  ORF Transcript_53720/g.142865 Transcript_53720/m.142865 type:complete len:235 (-) Transcript_53720:806-1510(-)
MPRGGQDEGLEEGGGGLPLALAEAVQSHGHPEECLRPYTRHSITAPPHQRLHHLRHRRRVPGLRQQVPLLQDGQGQLRSQHPEPHPVTPEQLLQKIGEAIKQAQPVFEEVGVDLLCGRCLHHHLHHSVRPHLPPLRPLRRAHADVLQQRQSGVRVIAGDRQRRRGRHAAGAGLVGGVGRGRQDFLFLSRQKHRSLAEDFGRKKQTPWHAASWRASRWRCCQSPSPPVPARAPSP